MKERRERGWNGDDEGKTGNVGMGKWGWGGSLGSGGDGEDSARRWE